MHVFILRALSRGNTLATSCKELTHWKIPWCWEGLGAGEGDDRGWDGWMASLTQWTWVWVNSRSWYGQGGLACCDSWGCRVRYDRVTELNWTEDYSRMKSAYSKNFWPKHYQHTPINCHNDHPFEGKKNVRCLSLAVNRILLQPSELRQPGTRQLGSAPHVRPRACWNHWN